MKIKYSIHKSISGILPKSTIILNLYRLTKIGNENYLVDFQNSRWCMRNVTKIQTFKRNDFRMLNAIGKS